LVAEKCEDFVELVLIQGSIIISRHDEYHKKAQRHS
jgi:hypothetical protein